MQDARSRFIYRVACAGTTDQSGQGGHRPAVYPRARGPHAGNRHPRRLQRFIPHRWALNSRRQFRPPFPFCGRNAWQSGAERPLQAGCGRALRVPCPN